MGPPNKWPGKKRASGVIVITYTRLKTNMAIWIWGFFDHPYG